MRSWQIRQVFSGDFASPWPALLGVTLAVYRAFANEWNSEEKRTSKIRIGQVDRNMCSREG